jgi:hypothetical protein
MKLAFIIKTTLTILNQKSMSRYKINNLEEYFKEYKKSVRTQKFGIASENFTQEDKVVDF